MSWRPSTARALAAAVASALLLGGVALLLALVRYPAYTAEVQLRVLPDPTLYSDDANGSAPAPDEYLTPEVLTLGSTELAGTVGAAVGRPDDVTLDATQVGITDVVQLTVRSSSEETALQAAQALPRVYGEQRRAALSERVESAQADVQQQLDAVSAEVFDLAGSTGVIAVAQREALTAEYARLLRLASALQLAEDAAGRLVSVVLPVDASRVEQVVQPLRDAALGALLGAVLGLSTGLVLARTRPRLETVEDLLEVAPGTALPTIPHLRGDSLLRRAGEVASPHVSALAGSDGSFGRPAPVVVVGPVEGVGASTTAVGLAVASAARWPTTLLAPGDGRDSAAAGLLDPAGADVPGGDAPREGLATVVDDLCYRAPTSEADVHRALLDARRAGPPGGDALVVDAPPLSRSPLALDLARGGAHVLLVGAVGRTTAAELHVAARAVERVGGTVTGVVLCTPSARPWGLPDGLRPRRARRGSADGGRAAR